MTDGCKLTVASANQTLDEAHIDSTPGQGATVSLLLPTRWRSGSRNCSAWTGRRRRQRRPRRH